MPSYLKSLVAFLCLSIIVSCVDRINFDIKRPDEYPVTISGSISNLRGPYTVKVIRSFDINSYQELRTPASVTKVTILDNQGNSEDLTEEQTGIYTTDPDGIRGVIGRTYRLRVELPDGDVIESIPDTLLVPGKLDTIYHRFEKINETGPSEYAFKIFFSGTNGESAARFFQWRQIGTFMVNTIPENDPNHIDRCTASDCQGCNACNYVWRCSGLRNMGRLGNPVLERKFACTCCTCWYNIFNDRPVIASTETRKDVVMKDVEIGSVKVNDIIFQQKVYVEVQQQSLSEVAYTFFKTIGDQGDAATSLFQPAVGKLPGNFRRTDGSDTDVVGIFYAAGTDSRRILITRHEVPTQTQAIRSDIQSIDANCLNLMPNSSNKRPWFWED